MSKQTIIQLREQDPLSKINGAGDYECVLAEPVIMKEGDVLHLSSAFVDTREISTSYIDIPEDTDVTMSFYLYNINHSGGFKVWGNDGSAVTGPASDPAAMDTLTTEHPVWRSSTARQDGEPYFLTTASATLPELSIINSLTYYPKNKEEEWGGCHITYEYYSIEPNQPFNGNTYFKQPYSQYSGRHRITIFLPRQEAGTESVAVPVSFALLSEFYDSTASPPGFKPVPFPEVFNRLDSEYDLNTINTQPLTALGVDGLYSFVSTQPGFPTIPGRTAKQLIMVPVQQSITIKIPKNKYLPIQLTKLINDAVLNFTPNQRIGIPSPNPVNPRGSGDPPLLPDRQRLPFGATSNTSDVIGGLPTFTQSNFIQCPPAPIYDYAPPFPHTDDIRKVFPVTLGDSFFCNATPVRAVGVNGIEIENSQGQLPGSCNLYSSNRYFPGYTKNTESWNAHPYNGIDMAAFIGSSQFALEFDTESNLFKFDYLHTPLYSGILASASAPGDICNYFINSARTISRKIEFSGSAGREYDTWYYVSAQKIPEINPDFNYGDDNIDVKTLFGGVPQIGPDPNYARKYVGANGGICFTALTPSSFWKDTLGFNLEPAVQDLATGEITKEGIITHYQLADIGVVDTTIAGTRANDPENPEGGAWSMPPSRYGFTSFNFPENLLEQRSRLYDPAKDYAAWGGISPQMPMIPFKLGMNATSGAISLESAIIKATPYNQDGTAWFLVNKNDQDYGGDNEDSQLPNGAWIEPEVNVIGDNTISIDATNPRLLNLANSGYFLIEIDTKINNTFISSKETKSTLAAIVNKYYSINSYTSSDGSNIEYIHRGNPQLINSVRVRVLNPDLTAADLGSDTTIFLTLTQQIQDPLEPQNVAKVKKK